MKDYRKFLDGSKADTKRFTEAPDYRLPLHHPKNNAGTTSAISPATQEIIAKETEFVDQGGKWIMFVPNVHIVK